MYIIELSFTNAAHNHTRVFSPARDRGQLLKWNLLDGSDASQASELLRILALGACGCTDYLDKLDFDLSRMLHDRSQDIQIELTWQEHKARNKCLFSVSPRESAIRISPKGYGHRLARGGRRLLPGRHPYSMPSKWSPPSKCTLFAYGPRVRAHQGSDDFDFGDAFYQLRRIHSLFNQQARLTDPVAFLTNLNYRGIRHRRYMPAQILQDMQSLFSQKLGLDTWQWMDKEVDFSRQWSKIPETLQQPVLILLDICRHLHDALPSCPNPLHFPGIVLLDRPDKLCPEEFFAQWIDLLDTLFPAFQFFISLPPSWITRCPQSIVDTILPDFHDYNQQYPQRNVSSKPSPGLPKNTVLLVDVDGRLPNLALMKISQYYKKKGYQIRLSRKEAFEPGAERVFASSVFNLPGSRKRLKKLQAYYGQALECGGSGVDVHKHLPQEIENTEPDLNLYPELQDRAIGFLTRGCPFSCSFCIVPVKEGKPRQVNDIETLAAGRHKLILLDDNILAHPRCKELLQEMSRKNLWINFNQTLDLSLVDADKAALIKDIQCCNVRFTRRVFHFSLNDCSNLETVREKYNLFSFTSRDNVEFICMYGYNTTLAQDVQRFRFLRSLPGAYVFVQEYQPILGGPLPQLDTYFDEHADAYIDELVQICFPQAMKSMEKFYRWLSKFYAQRFGKLHMGLVDTIFRYNKRFNRGKYIATLAGTRQMEKGV
ncbi:MAG: hypothetical protein ACLFT8_06680 [Desulfovermiculus sp.]